MSLVTFTTPVGRLVQGSLYKPRTTNDKGEPLLVNSGPNKGKPRQEFWISLAIAKKAGETHFSQSDLGKIIWTEGHKAFPEAAKHPSFSWKVIDGDDTTVGKPYMGKPGKRPCDREGYPGNWIFKFSTGFVPEIYRLENGKPVFTAEDNFIRLGHLVQVAGSVAPNDGQTPGVYLNYKMVAFSGYSEHGEIRTGMSAEEAGFGNAPLPAGASLTPPAASFPTPAAPAGIQAPPAYASTAPVPAVVPPPAVSVTPNPAFLQVPAPPAVPLAAPLPPATGPKMTAAAQASYEAYKAANWSDAQLIAAGLMTV